MLSEPQIFYSMGTQNGCPSPLPFPSTSFLFLNPHLTISLPLPPQSSLPPVGPYPGCLSGKPERPEPTPSFLGLRKQSEIDNSCFLCARDGLWCLTIISYKSHNSLRGKCLLLRILRVLGPRFRNGKIRIQTCACLPPKPTPFLRFQIPQPNSAFSAF